MSTEHSDVPCHKIDPYTRRSGIPGHGIVSDLPDPKSPEGRHVYSNVESLYVQASAGLL